MENNKLFIILFSILCLTGLTSCEDDDFDDDYDSPLTALLCDKVWVDFFMVDNYTECRRELTFYPNRKGMNYRCYFDVYTGEYLGDEGDPFYWNWTSSYQDAIVLEYPDGVSYFEDVWIRNSYLSGILDGYEVTFTDSYLIN